MGCRAKAGPGIGSRIGRAALEGGPDMPVVGDDSCPVCSVVGVISDELLPRNVHRHAYRLCEQESGHEYANEGIEDHNGWWVGPVILVQCTRQLT